MRYTGYVRRLAPFVGVVLFLGALWVLYREIADIPPEQFGWSLRAIPRTSFFAACLAVVASYFILTLSDAIAVRQAGASLPYPRVALASFISNAIGFNVGAPILSGGSVRYSLYSSFGLSLRQIAGVVAMCHVTTALGLWTFAGLALLLEPAEILARVKGLDLAGLPRLAGLAALALPGGIFALSALVRCGRTSDSFKKAAARIFPSFDTALLPGPGTLARQFAVGMGDVLFASLAIFFLLPHNRVPLPIFCGAFALSHLIGSLSQAPGGLGVFEAAMLWQLTPFCYGRTELLGAILVYRAVYCVVPLAAASVLLLRFELSKRLSRYIGELAKLVPSALSLWTFFAGASLVFAGVLPQDGQMVELSEAVLPWAPEFSRLTGSLIGTALLFLSRGLARRLRSAWMASVAALCAVLLFPGPGESPRFTLLLLSLLLVLVLYHGSFYRLSFFSTLETRWALTVLAVLAAAIQLGFFVHRHVEYPDEPWWWFAFRAGAPPFLRAALGMPAVSAALILWLWLRPSPLRVDSRPSEGEIERIVAESPASSAALALLGDKKFFTSRTGGGAVMYAPAGGFWIAMGDPIGRGSCARDLIWQFCEEADRRGAKPVFYEAGDRWLDVYCDNGLHLSPVGEEARVDLRALSEDLSGGAWKSLRPVRRRIQGEGWTFRVLEGEAREAAMPRLRAVSDEWLGSVRGAEKGFSLGFFDERYLAHFPIAVVERGGDIRAFCSLWMGAAPEDGAEREMSVDLMRHGGDAPEGAMSYLFLEAMLWGKSRGFGCFSLGMAPLSNMNPAESLWERAGDFLYRHGEMLYNFRGVRRYKEKFHPVWVPRYLVHPGAASLPLLLPHLARLIS